MLLLILGENNFMLNYKWHFHSQYVASTVCQKKSINSERIQLEVHVAVHTMRTYIATAYLCFNFQSIKFYTKCFLKDTVSSCFSLPLQTQSQQTYSVSVIQITEKKKKTLEERKTKQKT